MRGLSSADFQDALSVVRSIVGRRWNPDHPDGKRWELPLDRMTAEKVVHLLRPEMSAEFQAWYGNVRKESASSITTQLPDDAILTMVPWADKLRGYQRAAVAAMSKHRKLILADDMGLGKTVEAISTVRETMGEGPVLVVCPNKVRLKWKQELARWSGAEAVIIDGKTPIKRKQQLERAVKWNKWVIVNWEKLRIMPELSKVEWRAVIADEAHRAKNRKAKQTKALWKIQAPVQLALTGTPIQNSPDELWALLKWLFPKQYTSYWRFFNDYVEYYESPAFGGKIITGVRNPDLLRFELADKLIRRTKDEVLDLPPITWDFVPVELGPKQRKLYTEAEKDIWIQVKRDADAGDKQAERMLTDPVYFLSNGAARTTRLRQIASSPALLDGKDESAKLDAAVEIITDADRPIVVFSEFRKSCDLLVQRLCNAGVRAKSYKGGDSEAVVQEFQDGEFDVLVMTRDTGGEGIDLYRADTAIFLERHWTPARNQQAEARLHRMGQENPVYVIVLVATDTVDDGRVLPTNARKEAIVGSVL